MTNSGQFSFSNLVSLWNSRQAVMEQVDVSQSEKERGRLIAVEYSLRKVNEVHAMTKLKKKRMLKRTSCAQMNMKLKVSF